MSIVWGSHRYRESRGRALAVSVLLGACSGDRSDSAQPSATIHAPPPSPTGSDPAALPNPTLSDPGLPTAPTSTLTPSPGGPRRAALSAHFAVSDACAFSGQWLDVPAVNGGHPVSSSGHSVLLENAAPDSVVSCQVIESPQLRVLVTVGQFGGVNTLVTFAPALSLNETSLHALRIDVGEETARSGDSSCRYRALEISEDHTAFLGSFTCPHLVDDSLEGACQVDEAYFYVENCVPYAE